MTSYTLQVQPRASYTIEYANQRGPQGPTGPAGTGLSAIASGTILGNGLGDTALPQALNAVGIRTILDLATFDSPTFVGLTLSGLQQFTGTSTVGLRLKSLTSAEYNLLTPANGDLFRDSTTDRIDARLARGTVELIDSAGGQTIGGTLQATALSESAIAATGTGGLVRATSPTLVTPELGVATATSLTATGALTGTSATAASVAMIAKAAASQSASIQEWRNSSNTVLASIYPAGQLNTQNTTQILLNQGTIVVGRNGGNQLQYGEGSFWQTQVFYTNGVARFTVAHTGSGTLTTAPGAAVVGAIVRGAASQTANLQEWQNSAGTVLASVSSAGNLTASGTLRVGGGTVVASILSATATLDFGSIGSNDTETLTITVTGAVAGDSVFLGVPAGLDAGLIFCASVTAANTVTVRMHNSSGGSVDPASGTFRATVIRF